MNDTYKNWLNNLKIGDEVALRWGYKDYQIFIVAKTTATQIVLNDGQRFNKHNGYKRSSKTSYETLIEPTSKIKDTINRNKAITIIGSKNPSWFESCNIKTETLLEWANIIEQTINDNKIEFNL